MREAEDSRYAEWWFELAVEDLATARAIAAAADLPLRNAAHLAQQAAEKALKATIARDGREPPRTHDLVVLASRAPATLGLNDLNLDLVALGDASVHGRYPDVEDPPYDLVEVERLFADAAVLLDAIAEFLASGRPGPHGESPEARFAGMPGWELVSAGLDDLAAGRETVAALLVASASQRLGTVGLDVHWPPNVDATRRLYELVEADVGVERAHGRYNALRRRLASFLRSVDATAS